MQIKETLHGPMMGFVLKKTTPNTRQPEGWWIHWINWIQHQICESPGSK
jgi:hypothetical protein